MHWVVLGLGTNLGARRAILEGAIALLGDRVLARSALYATPPLGPPQPDYLNAALRIRWDAPLTDLLVRVQQLEHAFGRERVVHWGPRTLDIDILHWSGGSLDTPALRVPHPERAERTFVLAPLLDVAPELEELAPRLSALGGPPSKAIPGWSTIVRQGSELCGEWLHDPDELVAQFFALAGQGVANDALAVRSFVGPPELLAEGVLEGLTPHDFEPVGAAVLRRDAREASGVLLGVPRVREAARSAGPRLERRADGARRFVVPRPASSWR